MGMGGGGKGAPAPPDFMAVANEQTRANRPNQTTPWASSRWTGGPGAPGAAGAPSAGDSMFGRILDRVHQQQAGSAPSQPWEQQISLSPGLDQANQSMMGQFAQANANPLDNGAQARQHTEDAIYGRAASRLDPRFAQEQHNMETQLANQGIDPNSQAYATALGNFGRTKNDAYSTAMQDSIMGGGQEAQRQQGMDLQSRMAPLQGMGALKGLTGMPGFDQSQILPAAMAQYQSALQQYGIDQQGKNSTMGGLMGLGGTLGAAKFMAPVAPAAAASDERLKEDVIRHPMEILPGVPVASFRYRWEPEGTVHVGVIAQDVEKVRPDLVTFDSDGYRMVPGYLLLR